ncbi:Oxoglutarate/iron-dependent dioxygenase - like 10 [Theobroma cacao]|nr:Oxoglutarate/iron-dependent dioxygenase - like 10 [Theobroma cacao]
MDPKAVKYGSSLLVPSVQELAKKSIATIPPRYLRPYLEKPIVSDAGSMSEIRTEIQDFFNLPMEEKKKYWQFPGEVEGFGQAFVVSDEQKLDWGDMFFLTTLPVYSRKPHLFPKLPLPFRDTLNQYSLALEKLAMAVLVQIAEAINMNIITNGVYRSIEHRATVNSEKERLSIATFCSPNYNGEVGPAPSLISEGNQALFRRYGSSLLVPSVQELAKKSIATIPPRYLRPDLEKPIVSDASLMSEIPVIDMEGLVSKESMDSELAKLDFACKEWVEKVKTEIQDFFNLPMEEKKKYWQNPGEVEGFGQAFVVSDEQKLGWNDMFFLTTLPVYSRKPRLFPKLPLPFRETLNQYSLELEKLAMAILLQIAKAINMNIEEMREFFEGGLQAMRMNYYPPCGEPEQVIGAAPHSDASALTILLQVNEVEGLQVKKDGKWVPVKPLPNSFIVNIGDALEVITNGAYCSIEHRATVNSEKERLSIATFCNPNYNGEVGPAPSLISEGKQALLRRVRVEDYLKALFARQRHEISNLDSMRI